MIDLVDNLFIVNDLFGAFRIQCDNPKLDRISFT